MVDVKFAGMRITGQELRSVRVGMGLSRQALADMLDETVKNVGNWERTNVPEAKTAQVRRALFATSTETDYLRSLSDTALIAELARRLSERQSAPLTPPLMQGETDFPKRGGRVNVSGVTTSATAAAGPHSPPRSHR